MIFRQVQVLGFITSNPSPLDPGPIGGLFGFIRCDRNCFGNIMSYGIQARTQGRSHPRKGIKGGWVQYAFLPPIEIPEIP